MAVGKVVERSRLRATSIAVRKAFGAFGEVVETRVVLDSVRGHKCTVAYSSRSAAEFAKEAMTGQSLRPDGGELVQVRWAKEQASTSETGKFSFVAFHAGRAKAPAARAAPAAPPRNLCRRAGAARYDASSKRTYYHDEDGSHVTWARPTERAPSVAHLPPLPPGWRRHFDKGARGGVCYHNNVERRDDVGSALLVKCSLGLLGRPRAAALFDLRQCIRCLTRRPVA